MTTSGIAITQAIRLVDEKDLWKQFARFGLSRRGFRALIRNLGVPLVITTDDTALVDVWSFACAFRAICSQGQPDFVMPGATVLSKGKRARKGFNTRLDPATFVKNHSRVVSEMMLASEFNGATKVQGINTMVAAAAARMSNDALNYLRREKLLRDKVKDPHEPDPSEPVDEPVFEPVLD